MTAKSGGWAVRFDLLIRMQLWLSSYVSHSSQCPRISPASLVPFSFTPCSLTPTLCLTSSLGRVWEVASGDIVRSMEGHSGNVCSIALTADGAKAVTGGVDSTVK